MCCSKRKARCRLALSFTEEQIIAVLREQMPERIRPIWRANIEAATDGGCAGHFRLQCPRSAVGWRVEGVQSRPGELRVGRGPQELKGERRVTGCMRCMSNMRACPYISPGILEKNISTTTYTTYYYYYIIYLSR